MKAMLFQMFGTFLQDMRLAGRGLRRSPAFAIIAISSLALGIGANAAIFSFVDAILLKRLPVPHPERLVQLREFEKNRDVNDNFTYPFIRQLAAHNPVFEGVAAIFPVRINLTSSDTAEPLNGELVTGPYFKTLGVRPALGRLLSEEDIRASAANPVCVISYSLWQGRFSGDPHIIGRSILLNSRPYRVIGVTQAGFYGAQLQSRVEVQVPLSRMGDFMAGFFPGMGITWDSANFNWLVPLARLKPGMTRVRAEAMLQPIVRQILLQVADPHNPQAIAEEKRSVRLLDGSQGFNMARQRFGNPIGVLMGVVGLVLLIACANLANLLLARGSTREKEFAVRLSLGASRSRLIRQLMTESLAIAACGAMLGILLSFWIVDTLLVYFNEGKSAIDSLRVSPDPVVIFFSIALSVVAALAFGLAPAWQSVKRDLLSGLKEASMGTALHQRALLRKAIIAIQLSLSLVMLFAAGLLIRTLGRLQTVDLGFTPAKVIALSVDPSTGGYSATQTNEVYDEILSRLRSTPGIAAASIATISPLDGSSITLEADFPGRAPKSSDIPPAFNAVSPGYFATLNQPLLLGRDFSDHDAKGAPTVAVVNERFVEQYTPGQNPIGRRFKQGGGDVEIVGVVRTARYRQLREMPSPVMYYPVKQTQSSGFTLLVRGNSNSASSTIASITHTIHAINPKLPIQDVRTLQAQIEQGISSERILSFLSTLFSALAILLCGIGLYGIVAYAVSRRTREIGVRFAIGARKSDVAKLFLGETLVLIAAGMAIGIPVALASTRVLKGLLYGLEPTDIPTLAVASVLLVIAALLATFLPVRRAAAIEPLEALRYE